MRTEIKELRTLYADEGMWLTQAGSVSERVFSKEVINAMQGAWIEVDEEHKKAYEDAHDGEDVDGTDANEQISDAEIMNYVDNLKL